MQMKTALFCSLLMVTFLAGCGGESGPPMGKVIGKVTLYGKPYPKALVTFSPEGGGPAATGSTDDNGDFELWTSGTKGAAVGNHLVSVVTIKDPVKTEPVAATSSDDPAYAAQAFGGAAAYKANKDEKEKIPAKYNKSTELKHEVKSGSNKIDLELK
jgi:hypothetical protein